MGNGRIRKRENKFTQVSNAALRDPELSLKAKGLYSLINSYLTIPDWTLYKSFLMSQCIEGETAFESGWKELKDAGYLVQHKFKDEGGFFYYEYELLDEKKPYPENQGMVNEKNPDPENRGLDNRGLGNHPLINNTDVDNTEGRNTKSVSQSVSPSGEPEEKETNELTNLFVQAHIENFQSEQLKDNIRNAITAAYNNPETKAIIKHIQLEHIDRALAKFREAQEEKDIKNPKQYFLKCLLSAIEEYGLTSFI